MWGLTLWVSYITNQRRLNCIVQDTAYRLNEIQYPEYDKKLIKFRTGVKIDTLFMTRNSKTHTLFS